MKKKNKYLYEIGFANGEKRIVSAKNMKEANTKAYVLKGETIQRYSDSTYFKLHPVK